ncbi:MAG TPA: DUF4956 domain-containing protein [Aggregatilinea sp.]|jgi:hypothetical protein|uniref:DUF4956 domain-containing protein n=1 Tax=Aggregatilinea sp. TaxID=2806333 RepID=UPI002C0361FD|nr:DUF4956 domain-containing protein [Aggregatilinea sp.]HML22270.1 DUF4956 domain-containing protein [Aggregatilinea sp.]
MGEFLDTLMNFALNLAIVFVIVRLIYYPRQRDKNYVFTFFVFNTVVFFVMGLLNNSDISVGVGFGLFAIFSILRYRTDTIPIREMTYLFVLIALPVLNSILLSGEAYGEFAVANMATIGVLYVLEQGWGFDYEVRKTITYERIEMIRPENWPQLKADLETRTGLPIKRIEIGRLNFLRDTAQITVYYDARALDTSQVRFATSEGVFAGDAGYDD